MRLLWALRGSIRTVALPAFSRAFSDPLRVRSVPFEAWEPESLCAVSLTGLIETCDVCYAYTRTELIELRALLEGAQAMLALEHLVQQTLYPRN